MASAHAGSSSLWIVRTSTPMGVDTTGRLRSGRAKAELQIAGCIPPRAIDPGQDGGRVVELRRGAHVGRLDQVDPPLSGSRNARRLDGSSVAAAAGPYPKRP